jgi:putative transposase
VHNHAQAIVACDFFVVFTARFRILYVFVVMYVFVIMELGRRRILHHNLTAHPSAEWTLQQFREALTEERPYRFLIHDRDSIFSKDLGKAVTAMGVRVVKTPVRATKANAVCERLVGTIRRECLDFLILFGERHLKQVLTNWVAHYNHAWVHTSLGPGVPDPIRPSPPMRGHRHRLPAGHLLRSKAVLGGLPTNTGWTKWLREGSNRVFADHGRRLLPRPAFPAGTPKEII